MAFPSSSSSILSDWPSEPPMEVGWGAAPRQGSDPAPSPGAQEGSVGCSQRARAPSRRGAPRRAPRSWVDPGGGPAACAPRVLPPQTPRGASFGDPPRAGRSPPPAAPPLQPRRRGPDRMAPPALPAPITRAPRAWRPLRVQSGSKGARGGPGGGAGEPRARTWRPGRAARGSRALEQGASEPRSLGAAAAVSGLAGRTSPPQVCERPPARRQQRRSGPGECQARNNYKRKRRLEEEEETLFTFEQPSRRRSHKRRTRAAAASPRAPAPPHRGPRVSARPRPSPAPGARERGPGAAGAPAPPADPPWPGPGVTLGKSQRAGKRARGALGSSWSSRWKEGPALMTQGHSLSGRAPARTGGLRPSDQPGSCPWSSPLSPAPWE